MGKPEPSDFMPDFVTFTATLEPGGPSFMPTQVIVLPDAVREALGGKATKRVVAHFGPHTERLTLLVQEGGGRYLMIRKTLCAKLGVKIGHELTIGLLPDPEPDRVDLPAELQEALAAWPEAEAAYQRLNASSRRAMSRQVEDARTAETRARRAVQLVERLARGGNPFRPV